jgi:hypothetical protein
VLWARLQCSRLRRCSGETSRVVGADHMQRASQSQAAVSSHF